MPSIRGDINVSFGQQRHATTNAITHFEVSITLPATVKISAVGVPVPPLAATSRWRDGKRGDTREHHDAVSSPHWPRLVTVMWNGRSVNAMVQGGHAIVKGVGPGGEHSFVYDAEAQAHVN